MSKNTGLILAGLVAAGAGAYFLFNRKPASAGSVGNNGGGGGPSASARFKVQARIKLVGSGNPGVVLSVLAPGQMLANDYAYKIQFDNGPLSWEAESQLLPEEQSGGVTGNGGLTARFNVTNVVKLIGSGSQGVVLSVLAPGQMLANEYAYKIQFDSGALQWVAESQLLLATRPTPLFHPGDKLVLLDGSGLPLAWTVTVSSTYAPGRFDPPVSNPIWGGMYYQYWVVGSLYPNGNGIPEQYLQKA